MALQYQLPELAAMPVPTLSGRFLAHNRHNLAVRAFFGADLHLGAKRPDKLTRQQSAGLARVSSTYVWWAEKRMAERAAIEAGVIPLVPASPISKANGNGTIVPMSVTGQMPDPALIDFVRSVGVTRVLEAACAVEAAE
jgi:hypothetical protein